MTSKGSSKQISPKDFSGGVILPLILPRSSNEAALTEAIAEQSKRFSNIDGVIGVEVNTALEVKHSSHGRAHLDCLKATRDALNAEKMLIVDVGSFSNEHIEKCAACAEFGADAIVTKLHSIARAKSAVSNNDFIAHQAKLADQTCLPVLLDQPCSETEIGRLHDCVAQRSENVVGIVMRHDDRTQAYDENYYAIKAMDRPIACLTASDTALFHNINTGADGVISKLASIAPYEVVALFQASREGRFFEAQATHNKLSPLVELVGNQPQTDRYAVFCAIAKKRGLLGSAELANEMGKLDPSTIRRIDRTLEAVALIPID